MGGGGGTSPLSHNKHIPLLPIPLTSSFGSEHCRFPLLCAGSKAAAGGSAAAVEGSYAKVAIQRQESEVIPSTADTSTRHESPILQEVAQESAAVPAVAVAADEQVLSISDLQHPDLQEQDDEGEGSVGCEDKLASESSYVSEDDEQEDEESDLSSETQEGCPAPVDVSDAATATADSPDHSSPQSSPPAEAMQQSLHAAGSVAVGGSVGGRVKVSLHLERHSLNDLEVELLAAWFKVLVLKIHDRSPLP